MKISYDPKADAISINFADNIKSSRTEEMGEDFVADYSGKTLISLEILDVSKKLPGNKFDSLTLNLPKMINTSLN